jgi:hypothetical protein
LLAQKRTKKGSRSLGQPAADYLALLAKIGRFGKSLCSAESFILSLLCCSAA